MADRRATGRQPAALALAVSLLWASSSQAVPLFEGDPVELAAYGDSLTGGGDWFPYLPAAWSALDFGQAGDECWNDVVPRLELDLDDPIAPPEDSDVVVIFCGTNDVRLITWTLDRSMDEIEAGTLGALAAGLPVVIVAPPPIFTPTSSLTVPEINDRLEQVRDAIAALVADEIDLGEQVRFANQYDAFLQAMRDGATIDDLYADGIHPIGLGRQIEAEVITDAVLALPEPAHEILVAAGLMGLVAAAHARRRRL